jgi:hypothetical protein
VPPTGSNPEARAWRFDCRSIVEEHHAPTQFTILYTHHLFDIHTTEA